MTGIASIERQCPVHWGIGSTSETSFEKRQLRFVAKRASGEQATNRLLRRPHGGGVALDAVHLGDRNRGARLGRHTSLRKRNGQVRCVLQRLGRMQAGLPHLFRRSAEKMHDGWL